MIAMLTGWVHPYDGAQAPTTLVVNPSVGKLSVGLGVGFAVTVSDRDRPLCRERELVRLHVHTVMSDSAFTLFGFLEPQDCQAFRELIAIPGVGTGTAMRLISALSKDVRTAELGDLQAVPGIGPKLADKIVKAFR